MQQVCGKNHTAQIDGPQAFRAGDSVCRLWSAGYISPGVAALTINHALSACQRVECMLCPRASFWEGYQAANFVSSKCPLLIDRLSCLSSACKWSWSSTLMILPVMAVCSNPVFWLIILKQILFLHRCDAKCFNSFRYSLIIKKNGNAHSLCVLEEVNEISSDAKWSA